MKIRKTFRQVAVGGLLSIFFLWVIPNAQAAPVSAADHQAAKTVVVDALKNRRFSRADQYIKGLLKKNPEDPVYWALQAKVAHRIHHEEEANKALENALKYSRGSVPPVPQKSEVVEPENNVLASADSSRHPTKWRIYGMMDTGYDNNVSLLPDNGGITSGSFFVRPGAMASFSDRLSDSPFVASAQLSYAHNFSEIAMGSDNLPLGLNANWILPGTLGREQHLSISYASSFVFLTHTKFSLFSISNALVPQKTIQYSKDQILTLMVPISYSGYPGVDATGADVRTGFGAGLSGSYQHHMFEMPFSESLSYGHQFSLGDNFKFNSLSASVGASGPEWNKITPSLTVGLNYLKYPAAVSNRYDLTPNVLFQATRSIGKFDLMLVYGYLRNDSNLATAKYTKQVISLKGAYEFF